MVIGRGQGGVLVRLRGELDWFAARHLEVLLRDLIEDQGNLRIAVDLLALESIAPSAIDLLSRAAAWMERHGGSLRLHEPGRARVRHALEEAGLGRFGDAGRDEMELSPGPPGPETSGAHSRARAAHPSRGQG